MKRRVVLFQPYLRRPILSFGKQLQEFEFVIEQPSSGIFYQSQFPKSFEKEVERTKTHWLNRIRQHLGILNIRIKFDRKADIFFTYGCFLLTNRPYCIYIENSLALFNYNLKIAQHPCARWLFTWFVQRKNCKKLIFMSQAAQQGFLTYLSSYSPTVQNHAQAKSIQLYPALERSTASAKKPGKQLRLLFVGMFYVKGGDELIKAFEQLKPHYPQLALTIVTPFQIMRVQDRERIRSLQDVSLIDASLSTQQMEELYRNHDVFILPTYRDSFGLVFLEALSWGLPIICTDHYATPEIVQNEYNGFLFPHHPLKDYDPVTYAPLGKYYNPKDFYRDLFALQKSKALQPVVDFLVTSIERFLKEPQLLEEFSANSLSLYDKRFDAKTMAQDIETVFRSAVSEP